MTTEMDDPGSYGRIVRGPDGDIERIVEAKTAGDATEEELAIKEVNAGTYAFTGPTLADALDRLKNDNAQGDDLGDTLPLLRESGLRIAADSAPDPGVNLGINDRADLARAADEARRRILVAHMRSGVTIEDPGATWIDADVEIAAYYPARHHPARSLQRRRGQHDRTDDDADRLSHRRAGHGDPLLPDVVRGGERRDRRPLHLPPAHARIGEGAKAGTFVEIKNSEIGAGAKVPHLAYIGDADVGEGSNLGASTVTANYDGRSKYRTKIGKKVRTALTRPSSRP